MPTDDFATAVADLKNLGGQRVWSLMISLFGDLARNEGDVIDGPILSAIMAAMDVRPEAARVALHRLRKDQWITSLKRGRTARHSLTPEGRAQSQAASTRIYATPDELDRGWQMVLLEKDIPQEFDSAGFTMVQPRLYVGPAHLAAPKDGLVLEGKDAPEWLKRQLEPASLEESYVQLRHALENAVRSLPKARNLTPLEIATLRCLIVHNWRRLALKHPALPRPLMRDDWAGLVCHILVADLLARYPRPATAQIAAP